MSQTAITLAFEQWKASQSVTGDPVLLDEFVFASVPGLDATKPIDRNETLPPDAQIVHRQAVSRKGVVNENAVVHSVVLGAEVGDFSFNWIGLINKASNTLAMIVHAPLQQKLKTKDGQQGNVLIQPGEQLQQQRAEVSQRVTQAGDWVRQTDQTISETSMARVVKADTEQRELVSRETTVKATDKITVLGTSTLLAGAIQQVCTGDYSQAVNNRVASIGGNDETDIAGSQTVTTGKDLIEKIGQIRKSVAAEQQQIIAPVVWIGSGTINVAQLMLDTLDVVKELAEQTASHTHSNTGAPTNAGAIRNTGTKADTLNGKYSPVIGK